MKKLYICLIAALCCMTACEKPIEFDMDETDPMIVLSSIVEPDSAVATRVTLSRFFLDNTNFKVVNDASLQLTVNGVPAGSTVFKNGYYVTNVVPQPGDSLQLVVTVPSRGSVSAGTKVPYSPDVTSLRMISVSSSEQTYWNTELKFSFVINDESSTHVGYLVKAVVVDSVDVDTTFQPVWNSDYSRIVRYDTILPHLEEYRYAVWMESEDPLLSQGLNIDDFFDIFKAGERKAESVSQFLFLDDGFSGKSHEFLIKGTYYNYDDDGRSEGVHHRHFELQVSALNYDLYMYTKTRMQAWGADELFSEPVQIYCNVKGGIGIFGAISRMSKLLNME